MAGIVSTIGQKCRRCFSCIRECPATAIRVVNGQAFVITERCLSCGHCVKVCSQHAKEISSDIEKVLFKLIPKGKTVAMVAPSFAASFPNDYLKLPSALKSMGFIKVTEAAFGADLISPLYGKLFEKIDGRTIISSPCPAIYNYIEKYFTELVPNLAPIVSPMIAMGRYLKETLGNDIKVVFIGPCVAKKSEYIDEEVNDAVDAVLTFTELKKIFNDNNIDISSFNEIEFDPPYANLGKSFPLTGGLLKTAKISGDILAKKVIVVDGKEKVEEIIQDVWN
ncbi:MAG: histidine kinase, partial [Melioribacteraceae bacterium]